MKIYTLASADFGDNETSAKVFKTLEEAQDEMEKQYADAMEGCDLESEDFDYKYYIGPMSAAIREQLNCALWLNWVIEEHEIEIP